MVKRRRLEEGEFWADKLMDLANLSAIVLVFGQFVSPKIDWQMAVFGVLLYVLFIIIAKKLRNRR